MAEQNDAQQEQRTVIRLRDAIAFYDGLPEKTKKQFRETTDDLALHFGFGMFLRNAILWKNDITLLAAELRVVKEEVENGSGRLTYTQVGRMADQRATGWLLRDPDDVSGDLMDVLRLREGGKLELLELN
jgi:hypothetical protein